MLHSLLESFSDNVISEIVVIAVERIPWKFQCKVEINVIIAHLKCDGLAIFRMVKD